MSLRICLTILFSLFLGILNLCAQTNILPTLNIGDKAPPLFISKWIKGTPIKKFEKGKIYVVDFWATWCQYCIQSMPELSTLAELYKDNVTVLGINIFEKKSTSIERITSFVDSMGKRMNFNVAVEESNFMATNWLYNSGEQGIPTIYIVNGEGRIAWIGHPIDFDKALEKVVTNNWDINDALVKRNRLRYLIDMDYKIGQLLNDYAGDSYKPGDLGKPDSALIIINEIVEKEPELKYASFIGSNTFTSLLKTDLNKAYEFGQKILVTKSFEEMNENVYISLINWYSDKIKFTPEIFELGAEFYQSKINKHYDIINVPKNYKLMAEMYWKANNKLKAIKAGEKAIIEMKSITGYDKTKLEEYEADLKKYNEVDNE